MGCLPEVSLPYQSLGSVWPYVKFLLKLKLMAGAADSTVAQLAPHDSELERLETSM